MTDIPPDLSTAPVVQYYAVRFDMDQPGQVGEAPPDYIPFDNQADADAYGQSMLRTGAFISYDVLLFTKLDLSGGST
jgi:hypothetical protein